MFNSFVNWAVNCKYFTAEVEDAIFGCSAVFFFWGGGRKVFRLDGLLKELIEYIIVHD